MLTGGREWEKLSNEEAYKIIINALLSGYQIALYRTLGNNPALTQILITELGDILIKLNPKIEEYMKTAEDIGEAVPHILKDLRIAREISVEKKDSTYHITIEGSIFEPFAIFMKEKNIRTTLSPEAILVAAIIRAILRHKDPNARVTTRLLEYEPGKPLHVEVKIIRSMATKT